MTTTTDTSAMTLAQKSDRILAQTRGLSGATPNATRLIEELRLALESNRNDVQRLTAERDEARREVCIRLGWHFQIVAELEARTDDKHHTWNRFKEAAYRKWDCFKENTDD